MTHVTFARSRIRRSPKWSQVIELLEREFRVRRRLLSHAALISNTATMADHKAKPATPIMKKFASVIGQDHNLAPPMNG
ncbi:hypothetical protein CO675_26920 [Bradyrhizobium sp. C9]|nr:hypothetical protein CO675_26920 [Bradyrhizobium sp. C9]